MKTSISTKYIAGIAMIALMVVSFLQTHAQSPGIDWQTTIGGSDIDYLNTIERTPDGGYIIGGHSWSGISGDKTEPTYGTYDYWIVKLYSSGSIEWQNTIGGDAYDGMHALHQTADGGYIMCGNSVSGISYDKTEACIGENDYWIVKVDAGGTVEWDNTIGGTGNDVPWSIDQTSDGGYIVGGSSSSGMSGDKLEAGNGVSDYWILKLDADGNIEWQNTIGGSHSDDLKTIRETNDGGYIVGGESWSPASGDKTEPVIGGNDYWILKLDGSGNILWQNTIGGSYQDVFSAITPTSDNGFVIGGYSQSNISGDKTEDAIGDTDYWVVKIDSAGNIEWQHTIGGVGADYLQTLIQTEDGGYLLGGNSYSDISGDKTENAKGFDDYWVVKINANGAVMWENTIGGNLSEDLQSLLQDADDGYLLGGFSYSGISGDKNEPSNGSIDMWLVKLYPESEICYPPSGFTVNALSNRAKIQWDAVEVAEGYKVRYRIANTETWSVKYVHGKEFTILKPLECNTEYEFQALSICTPDGSDRSAYTESGYFTTAGCRLSDDISVDELLVYPNPASDKITVVLPGTLDDASIRITDMNGKLVYEMHVVEAGTGEVIINTADFSNGIYQIQFISNHIQFSDKFIVTH